MQIKNWRTDEIIFEGEYSSVMQAVDVAASIRADLKEANLRGADLTGADLYQANLRGTNLRGADLYQADLRGAETEYGTLTVNPVSLTGLFYSILITEYSIKIGCEHHKIEDWESFDNAAIAAMDGKDALKFWAGWKSIIMSAANTLRKSEVER